MVDGSLAYASEKESIQEVEIAESPVKYCTVKLSDVVARGKRLEASVFDVEAKLAWDQIINCKYGTISLYGSGGMIENAYYPGWMQRSRLKRIYCEKQYGEGFYLPSQMTDIYPTPEKYISRLADCDMDELRLKKNTLLLSRSGTIGSVSYVSKTLDRCIFSDDVIRISFKEKYDLGFVYAFLKTELGNLILRTNGYGSVITHIEPSHLEEIKIPNAPISLRKRVHNLIERSYSLRDESNELIDNAKQCLAHELRLPEIWNLDVKKYKNGANIETYSVKLSNIAGRIDASYHIPIVDAIVDHMRRYAAEVTTVGDSRVTKAVILPPRFARVYVDEGYGRVLIGGKQIHELDPSGKKYISNTKHEALMNRLEVHQNTTLITRSGTIGKVALVPRHWEKWVPSDHIIRVVPANREIAGYLNIFLSSEYGYELIKRYTYGSVVDEIDDNHVRSIPFPLLRNQDIQKQINDLALEASEKRYQAYLMEQEALKIMNDEVIFAK